MWKGTIHLEGEPLTRKIEGVMPSPSFKFYHKKKMFLGPFDLLVNFSRRRLGKFKIPSLPVHKEFFSLCTGKLGILI